MYFRQCQAYKADKILKSTNRADRRYWRDRSGVCGNTEGNPNVYPL